MARVKIVPDRWSRRARLGLVAVGAFGLAVAVPLVMWFDRRFSTAWGWQFAFGLVAFGLPPMLAGLLASRAVAGPRSALIAAGLITLGTPIGCVATLLAAGGLEATTPIGTLLIDLALPALVTAAVAITAALLGVAAARVLPPRLVPFIGHPCHACGYDRSGSPTDAPCPECADSRPPCTTPPQHRLLDRLGRPAFVLCIALALGASIFGIAQHQRAASALNDRRGALAAHGPAQRSFLTPDWSIPTVFVEADVTIVIPPDWPAGWALSVRIPRGELDRANDPMQVWLVAAETTIAQSPTWWEPPVAVRCELTHAQAERVRAKGLPPKLAALFEPHIPPGIRPLSVRAGANTFNMNWVGQSVPPPGPPVRIDPDPAFADA